MWWAIGAMAKKHCHFLPNEAEPMASNGDEEKYAMPPDDDLRNFARVAQRAIENKQDAMKYIDMLLDTGMIYHFDDDPAEGLMHGGKGWSARILPDITDLMGQRHKEMWNHIEPHDYLDLHPEMVDMMFERNEEGEVSPEDRQDLGLFTMGSDAFEQAWRVAKFAAPANYLDEIQGRLGSNTPQPPAQEPGKQVCQGCNMAKMNIDPNTGMCSVCSAWGPLNDRI